MENSPFVISEKDPEKRAAILKLIESPAYKKFIGALGLTSIDSNQVLWTHGVKIATVLLTELMIRKGFGAAESLTTAISYGALIKGVVCGVRVEEVEEELMREIRYLDKLIDELARGKPMHKILRA